MATASRSSYWGAIAIGLAFLAFVGYLQRDRFALAGKESAMLEGAMAGLVILVVAFIAWKDRNPERALAMAILGGLLIGHHGFMQDCVLLLLVFVVVLGKSQSARLRSATAIAMLPPLYLLLLLGPPYGVAVPAILLVILAIAFAEACGGSPDRLAPGHSAP